MSKRASFTPTALQREQAPSWVKYEVIALCQSRRLHDRGKEQLGAAVGNNAREYWRTVWTCALEAFLIHYRNLKDFLNNESFPSDVKGWDYSSTWGGHTNVVETYPNEEQR